MAFFGKVIDKLAGGPPNEKALEERKNWFFLSRYSLSICVAIGLTIIILGGYFIGFILNPAPKYEDLSVLQGQIISARRASPEFVVELANGEKVGMEWPGNYSLIGGIKSNGPLFGDNGVLKGCQAEIKYAPMRFVLGEHLRIWGLHCRNASLKFDYSEINTRFNNSLEGSKFFFSWSLVLIYILSFILFLREKRGHL